jgi:hypothetical protein
VLQLPKNAMPQVPVPASSPTLEERFLEKKSARQKQFFVCFTCTYPVWCGLTVEVSATNYYHRSFAINNRTDQYSYKKM